MIVINLEIFHDFFHHNKWKDIKVDKFPTYEIHLQECSHCGAARQICIKISSEGNSHESRKHE